LEELEPALGPIGVKDNARLSRGNGGAISKSKKADAMKKFEFLDPAKATLLIALESV
jgi:hypothetical protein